MNLLSIFKSKPKEQWEYGYCNGSTKARRDKSNKRQVQMLLWKKGDQSYVDGIGHLEDKWHNMGDGWWYFFVPERNNKLIGE